MSLTVVRPVPAGTPISQVWGQLEGYRRGTVNPQGVNGHPGTDYAVPDGARVVSCADGEVIWAAPASGFGDHCVSIWHPDLGVSSTYGHGQAHYVQLGQAVSAGDHIIDADNQGFSTGPHLHFEIRPIKSPFGGNPPNIDSELWLELHLAAPVIPGMSAADRAQVKRMQYLLGMPVADQTGYWRQITDNKFQTLRWKYLTPPRPPVKMYGLAAIQHDIFHFSAVDCDAFWGPKTDAAWNLARLMWLNK